MKGKRIGTSVLAALMLAGTTATSALAAMPDQTAVLGEKAFSLKYVNASENETEIREAIKETMKAGKKIYVKARNVWYNNDESKLADTSVIPAVVYKTADSEVSYEAGDGEEATEGFMIKEISATGTHEITVAFTEAVKEADRDKASFVAKKGKNSREIEKVEWNEEKTEAILSLYSKITKGDYSVDVKGLELDEAKGEFKAEDEKIVDVVFKQEQTPVVPGTPATVRVNYELINQYGDKSKAGSPIVQATIAKYGTAGKDSAQFEVPANAFSNPLTTEYVYVVSIVVEGTTVTKQATLKIVKEAKIDAIELGNVYTKFDAKKDMKVKNPTASDETVFYMATVIKDQYGNEINRDNFDDTELISEDTVTEDANHEEVESKAGLGGMQVQAGGLTYRYVVNTEDSDDKTVYLELKGETTHLLPASVIAMVTGKVVTTEVEIIEATKTDTLAYDLPEYVVFGEKNYLENVEVYNQNGDAVKGKDLVAAFEAGILAPSSNYGTIVAEYDAETEEVDVYWDLTAKNDTRDSYAFLTTKTGTNKLANQNVTVRAKAYPIDASIKNDVAMLMLPRTTSVIKLSDMNVYDQYDRTMAYADAHEFVGAKINLMKKNAEGDFLAEAGVTTTTAGKNDWKWSIPAKADAGSETLKIRIAFTQNGNTVSEDSDFALKTIKKSEVVSIHAEAPEVLYAGTIRDGANLKAGDDYAEDFVVYGKTKSGAKVNLESSIADEYYSLIMPGNLMVADETIYVNEDKAVQDLGDDNKKNVLVHVIANLGSDINPETKTIELKSNAPKLTTLSVKNDKTVIIVDEDFTVAEFEAVIRVKDQYGVKFDKDPTTIIFLDYDKAAGSTMETHNADFDTKTNKLVEGLKDGESVKIKAFYGGDKYITFTVKADI